MATLYGDRDRSSGRLAKSDIKQTGPRVSSSASSASLGRFSSADQKGENSGSRKRPRSEYSHQIRAEPSPETRHNGSKSKLIESGDASAQRDSPTPLVHPRYRLSGDRGSLMRDARTGFDGFESDSDKYFRRQWTSMNQDHTLGHQRVTVEALHYEDSGRKRRRTSMTDTEQSQGWGSFVFSMMGGIAGKVLNFWRGAEFSGFKAGGGIGYAMTPSGPRPISASASFGSLGQRNQSKAWSRSMASIPGQYPEDEDGEQHVVNTPPPTETPLRATKRLQTTHAGDWVVVDSDQSDNSKTKALSSRKSQNSRPHSVGRSMPSRRSNHRGGRLSSVSYAGSPQLSRQSEASVASARSPRDSPQQGQSPASLDVQRYQARRKHEEKQNDASMRKLNRQLKAMIQEGKTALATKYEVGMAPESDEDEGFAELDV